MASAVPPRLGPPASGDSARALALRQLHGTLTSGVLATRQCSTCRLHHAGELLLAGDLLRENCQGTMTNAIAEMGPPEPDQGRNRLGRMPRDASPRLPSLPLRVPGRFS